MITEDKRMHEKRTAPIRRLVLLVLLASLASSAGASKRVTVAQLEQALVLPMPHTNPTRTWRAKSPA